MPYYSQKTIEHWDRGFESHSNYGCLSTHFCVSVSCVDREPTSVQGVLLNVGKYLKHWQKNSSERSRLRVSHNARDGVCVW
jgi:hypothetical protein